MSITGKTSVLAVIGDPVSHSLSPTIHNGWIAEAGLDAVYVALRLSGPSPIEDLRGLARAGLAGLNITMPHKSAALAAAASASPMARRIGAANTLVPDGAGGWTAHNTDVDGFALALAEAGFPELRDTHVVMIGAGGAARAAVAFLQSVGARLTLVNRTRETAIALSAELAPSANIAPFEDLAQVAGTADLVVNSASFGHQGAAPPVLPAGKGRLFLDLTYGAPAEPMLAAARASGWRTADGLDMLLGQASAAFALWFGVVPNLQDARVRCRSQLSGAT